MFGFANGLLLALFAAAACDLALAVRRQHSLRGALGWLWENEHLLFGGWGAAYRTRLGEALFCAGMACYEVSVVFCNSMARENWAWVQGALAPALDWAAFLCFGAKILLGTRYSWRSLGAAGALYFIARWVHFNSHNIWFIGIVVAVLAAKDADLPRAMRAFFTAGALAMALVVGLHFAGIVAPDLVSERGGEYRQSYGYGHPNTFGGLFFGLTLAWVLMRARKLRWGDVALTVAAGVFLMIGPASRSAALCALGLAALLAFCRLWPRAAASRPVRWLCTALVPLVAAVSYLLPLGLVKTGPWNSDFGPAWLARIDDLLTNRLSLSWIAYRVYPIRIAGQTLLEWPPLDNSFVYALYQFGPVMAVILAVLLTAALWGLARTRRLPELCCLTVMLLYAFMECQSFHLTTDPAALLLCGAVFALPPERWEKTE